MAGPFQLWYIGGCNCPATTCTQTFTVQGCSGIGVAGLAVGVYASFGGALLASGTTDGSGVVALSWSGVSGTYYVAISGTAAVRFNAYGRSLVLECAGATTIALAPATGYHCTGAGCALPVKDVLNFTSAILGAATLNYNVGTASWQGSLTYAYPACPAKGCGSWTVPVDINYAGNVVGLDGWTLGFGNCPLPAGGGSYGPLAGAVGAVTCPLAFNFSATLPAALQISAIYCTSTDTITITE